MPRRPKLLDPTLDVVFKHLLTRKPALLRDMVQGVLARPIETCTIIDPEIRGSEVRERRAIFDLHVLADKRARIDLEMQRKARQDLQSRLVYYAASDYSTQLHRGDSFHQLVPSVGITWLVQPLFPQLERLHSIFELRERHTHRPWGDQMVLHILQLSHRRTYPPPTNRYTASVDRWARFFTARTDAERRTLASESPIMRTAMQSLHQLSQDPEVLRRARKRANDIAFYEMNLAMTREQGERSGRASMLLEMLTHRFGPPPPALRAQIKRASADQLQRWATRLLTASVPNDVFY